MLQLNWLQFSNLTPKQLYDILKLRSQVFVVEQQCVFLDMDDQDMQAEHLLMTSNEQLIGYLRIYPYKTILQSQHLTQGIRFGRLITAAHVRRYGYGKKLMTELLDYCKKQYPHHEINCSAQYRLKTFYESFGFIAQGEPYLEDDAPHIAMALS